MAKTFWEYSDRNDNKNPNSDTSLPGSSRTIPVIVDVTSWCPFRTARQSGLAGGLIV